LHEVPLTQEEIDRILRLCGTRALLIGGQALGVWAVRLGVLPPRSLGPTVSSDIDFVGSGAVASELCKALGGNWKTRQGTLDDAGSQVAKLYRKVGEDGVQQIDFLSGVVGLDAAAVRKRGHPEQAQFGRRRSGPLRGHRHQGLRGRPYRRGPGPEDPSSGAQAHRDYRAR
jgi:hypothetical protein